MSFDRSPFDGHRCRSVAAGDNIIAVAACEINVCERFMVIFIVVYLLCSTAVLDALWRDGYISCSRSALILVKIEPGIYRDG